MSKTRNQIKFNKTKFSIKKMTKHYGSSELDCGCEKTKHCKFLF